MTLPREGRPAMTTWLAPGNGVPYSVIVADDFGVTEKALSNWERYREHLGKVQEVRVSYSGIRDLPITEKDLANFLAIGSTGAGLALSGATCGYGGTAPTGTQRILIEIGVPSELASLVFHQRELRFVRAGEKFWAAEVDPE